jgi:transcriptional regulator
MSSFRYNKYRGVCYRVLTFMGYPKYRVGTDGSVWRLVISRKKWKKLRISYDKYGYAEICLYHNGIQKGFAVHRLVLFAFVGPCPKGMQTRHFPDDDKANNRLENLSWATPKVNNADKLVHGTSNRGRHYNCGEGNARVILTDKQVIRIRRLFAKGEYSYNQLANMFKASYGNVRRIIRGDYRKSAKGPITKKSLFKITKEQADEIRGLRANGYRQKEIASMYNIDPSNVSCIVRNKTHRR